MEGIFISYRREESAGHAGRIYDRLRERFGRERVFMDVSAIEPGVDFVETIDLAVGSCAVLLVIIGRKWLDCSDAAGRRRLDDTADFIRLEVGTALKRNIRVIPVLVQDADMPGEADLPEDLKLLARRHAIEINDTHWDTDLAQLVETLGRILGTAGTVPTGGTNTNPLSGVQKNRLTWLISSVTALLLALTGLLTGVESFRNSFVRLFKGSPQVTTTTGSTFTGSSTHPTDREPKIAATDSAPANGTQQEPAPPRLVTVPNVVRQPLERAVKLLTEAGLRPGAETLRATDKTPPGMVLNQKLKAGTTARRGTAVDLLVSAPPAAGDTSGDMPAAQKVLARGNLEVHQTYLFDLDSGQIVRNGDADFWFEAVTETERYLTPRNGAAIGLTREKTTYESCSQVKMTERRIPIQRIAESYYACVRTSRGNLGSFKLREPVGPSPGVMKISYITWERAR